MRAWRFHKTGDIANLILEDVPMPEPGPGEALVHIRCASLNPADRYLVQGQYPRAAAPPFTPGRDASGVVVKASADGRFRAGDRVCLLGGGLTGISLPGTLAEYASLPEAWLSRMPDGWSFEEAAAAPLVNLTAWRALVVTGGLTPGETVLVTGASGGVGTSATFIAHSLGARVIALSRDPGKRDHLRELGADTVLNTVSPDLEKEIKAAAGATALSLVIENLGGHYIEKSLRVTAPGGRIIILGLLADLRADITIGLLIHKNLRLQGMSVSAYAPEEAERDWGAIVALYSHAGKRPVISRVFGMEQVQDAFAHLHQGPMGKVVIRCSQHDD